MILADDFKRNQAKGDIMKYLLKNQNRHRNRFIFLGAVTAIGLIGILITDYGYWMNWICHNLVVREKVFNL